MKRIFLFYILLLSSSIVGKAQDTSMAEGDSLVALVEDSIDVGQSFSDSLVNYSQQFLGVHYVRGGMSKRGFDCSGFTSRVYGDFGIALPHSSAAQAGYGTKVALEELQKGDLIFFKSRNRSSKRVGHVGIVTSELGEPVRFIHASVNRGICITQLNQSTYYKPRFITARRIF